MNGAVPVARAVTRSVLPTVTMAEAGETATARVECRRRTRAQGEGARHGIATRVGDSAGDQRVAVLRGRVVRRAGAALRCGGPADAGPGECQRAVIRVVGGADEGAERVGRYGEDRNSRAGKGNGDPVDGEAVYHRRGRGRQRRAAPAAAGEQCGCQGRAEEQPEKASVPGKAGNRKAGNERRHTP